MRYFIMAVTGYSTSAVFDSYQPDKHGGDNNNCVTVIEDNETPNAHNSVMLARYQAIVRNTDKATAETVARSILAAVKESNTLDTYYGCYLTAAIAETGTSVTFAPDNGSGTTKASAFAVNDYILVGSEVMKVTSVASPNVTASRARLGTTIASHADNDAVYNITKTPIPGKRCDSTVAESGLIPMGRDEKGRFEYSVNWTVRFEN